MIYICELETRSFSFIAASTESAHHAWDAMTEAWQRHVKQTGATMGIDRDDCHEYELESGTALRDREAL